MKKFAQALLLAMVVAAPAAMVAPQAQASTATPQQQMVKASYKTKLTSKTAAGKRLSTKKHMHRLHKKV